MPCAGSGRRFGEKKQFVQLAGMPTFLHSLKQFLSFPEFESVALVIDLEDEKRYLSYIDAIIPKYKNKIKLVQGGAERYLSVKNGCDACKANSDFVFIHDAARPAIHKEDIISLINSLTAGEGLLAVSQPKDTIKQVWVSDGKSFVSKNLPRSELVLASTPQIFPLAELQEAYEKLKLSRNIPTDDTEIYMQLPGKKVKTYSLKHPNPKLTTREDVDLLERLLN